MWIRGNIPDFNSKHYMGSCILTKDLDAKTSTVPDNKDLDAKTSTDTSAQQRTRVAAVEVLCQI